MKSVKFFGVAALALSAIALIGQPVLAQKPGNAVKAGKGERREHEGRLEKILSQLNLSDAQKAQIKPILMEHHKQAKAIHEDTKLTADQKKDKLKELGKDAHEKILAILTPEQKEKLKELHHKGKGGDKKPAKP